MSEDTPYSTTPSDSTLSRIENTSFGVYVILMATPPPDGHLARSHNACGAVIIPTEISPSLRHFMEDTLCFVNTYCTPWSHGLAP